jgi:hypothetical protein
MSRPPFEERQQELNPHRDEERDHAADMAYSQLRQRGLNVTGEESALDLATLLESVERFEAAVSALGGDRMTNAPDSNQPDDARLVIPMRRDDEGVREYVRRIDAATERLGAGGTE